MPNCIDTTMTHHPLDNAVGLVIFIVIIFAAGALGKWCEDYRKKNKDLEGE